MIRTYWDYKTVLEVLDLMEFELYVTKSDELDDNYIGLCVRDLQGANLGNIESEVFMDFEQLMDRLDMYFWDYIVTSLEEEFENDIDFSKCETLIDEYNRIVELPYDRIKDYEWDINILGLWTHAYDKMGY